MIVSGLHSRAECPTALHLLHSQNGHEPDFCRCPGVLHRVQYLEQFELPVPMRFGSARIANHARSRFVCVLVFALPDSTES